MSTVLDRIRAKVTRAKQHIQDFQLGLSAFLDTEPYRVGTKEDVEAGKRIYYVVGAEPVPDHLTAIAADVIQNLRSSLDHIAYHLALDARNGTEPDWHVYYPISGSAADYPATRKGQIKGVRQQVIDAIDATEPYKGGKGHTLWQLNTLSKSDKHKTLIGAMVHSSGVDLAPLMRQIMRSNPPSFPIEHVKMPSVFIREVGPFLPAKVGDHVWGEPIDFEVNKDHRFAFNVSFDAPGVVECVPALKTLQDMANLVDSIVVVLGRFLP